MECLYTKKEHNIVHGSKQRTNYSLCLQIKNIGWSVCIQRKNKTQCISAGLKTQNKLQCMLSNLLGWSVSIQRKNITCMCMFKRQCSSVRGKARALSTGALPSGTRSPPSPFPLTSTMKLRQQTRKGRIIIRSVQKGGH